MKEKFELGEIVEGFRWKDYGPSGHFNLGYPYDKKDLGSSDDDGWERAKFIMRLPFLEEHYLCYYEPTWLLKDLKKFGIPEWSPKKLVGSDVIPMENIVFYRRIRKFKF